MADTGALVGCSNLIRRYVDDKFVNYPCSFSDDWKTKLVEYADKNIRLTIWDNPKTTHRLGYERGAVGFIVAFNIRDSNTFENLNKHISKIKKMTLNPAIVIVGTYSDEQYDRKVTDAEAREFCDNMNVPYFEVSAKTSINCAEAFEALIGKCLENRLIEEVSDKFVKDAKTLQATLKGEIKNKFSFNKDRKQLKVTALKLFITKVEDQNMSPEEAIKKTYEGADVDKETVEAGALKTRFSSMVKKYI